MNKETGRDEMSLHIRPVGDGDFDDILKINAESSPHVAELDAQDLRRLAALASIALVAADCVRVVGYMLAFSSSDVYEGEEFQSFRARLVEPFLYIDQVAVCAAARRANIASQMYAWLLQRSRELGIFSLCCGVNMRPPNPVSLNFHGKLGFESIGELQTSDGLLVALMCKETQLSAFRAITTTTQQDLPRLFEVWQSSVRGTHSFLTEADIQSLSPLVKSELASFKPIYCLRADDGTVFAFLGVAECKIEMLFVHAGNRGNGAGRLMSEFAINVLHADSVDVNEQNVAAIGFYRHLGFRQVHRSPVDSAGRAFPVLHLAFAPARTTSLR
jgi:predicted GNAT superfamily acetyltransferase